MNKKFNANISPCEVTDDDLKLINKHTVKELTAEEVYTFKAILCDNEVDRDCERFDNAALEKLAGLFVGVTVISDHNPESGNQKARTFDAKCEKIPGKKTSLGEDYTCVRAKAYMLRTPANAELIAEIDAGIKKEVSISCKAESFTCSVCGGDIRYGNCKHIKGKIYDGKICHCVLSDISDAYEWSFVAIPAQVNAGVTKGFENKFISTQNLIKSVRNGECVSFTKEQSTELCGYISLLEAQAEDGKVFRKNLTEEVVKFALISVPTLESESIRKMCCTAETEELVKLRNSFRLKASEIIPLSPQLKAKKETKTPDNNEYKF